MPCYQKRWRLAVCKIDQRIPCRLNYDAICHHISSNAVSGHTLGPLVLRPLLFAAVAMHISHIVKGFPCNAQDRNSSCPVVLLSGCSLVRLPSCPVDLRAAPPSASAPAPAPRASFFVFYLCLAFELKHLWPWLPQNQFSTIFGQL